MNRIDGWINFFTGLGTAKSAAENTFVGPYRKLPRETLENLYMNDGMARRIIDLPAGEMTRQWIEIDGDPEGLILKELDYINAQFFCRDLIKWSSLFGGAVMVVGADDGLPLDRPLNLNSVRKIDWLRIYDRHQVSWTGADLTQDPASKNYGLPEYYMVTPETGTLTSFRVHYSRVCRMDGVGIPERLKIRNDGWGESELLAVYERLRGMNMAIGGAEETMQDFVQTILQIKNLQDLIATGQEKLVEQRLAIISKSKSMINTILLDENENYTKTSSSVAGMGDILDRSMMLLASVTGIPVTKLFGRSAAGMNSTGDNDVQNWYDDVKSEQEEKLRPVLNKLVEIIVMARDYKIGLNFDDLTIKFMSLWQMSEMETADLRLKVAQADDIYLRNADPCQAHPSRLLWLRASRS